MNIKDAVKTKGMNSQNLQSMFMRVQLDAYFNMLTELFDDPSYADVYLRLLPYTALDDEFRYDFLGMAEITIPPDAFCTIGDMLQAAAKMISHNGYPLDHLKSQKHYKIMLQMEEAGTMIVEEIIIKPILRFNELTEEQ